MDYETKRTRLIKEARSIGREVAKQVKQQRDNRGWFFIAGLLVSLVIVLTGKIDRLSEENRQLAYENQRLSQEVESFYRLPAAYSSSYQQELAQPPTWVPTNDF